MSSKETNSECSAWDEAVTSGKFVKFLEDKKKIIIFHNARFERNAEDAKFHAGEMVLRADVFNEDGVEYAGENSKFLEVGSTRLLKKLRPVLEGKMKDGTFKVSIKKIGDKFETQYDVEELAA